LTKTNLVEIQPFEYQFSEGKLPRLITYFGYTFSNNLSQEQLSMIVATLKAKKKISIKQNPNGLIIWQYEGKPQIVFDKSNGKIFTNQGSVDYYHEEYCQKQAAYVLQILRKNKLADFVQRVVNYDPDRLGRTAEERKQFYEALERLCKQAQRKSLVFSY
jgi:hypothetical protein